MSQIITRNPLAFPAGRKPGFDPSHIGNKGATCTISTVTFPAAGSVFHCVDVLTGKAGTGQGGSSGGIHSHIGPYVAYASNNDASFFSGKPATVDTNSSFACIVAAPWTNFDGIFCNNNTVQVGNSFSNPSGNEIAFYSDAARKDSGAFSPAMIANDPYFMLGSQSFDGTTFTMRALVLHLKTGRVAYKTNALAGSASTAGSGTYTVGSQGGGFGELTGKMHACMYNYKTALSEAEMRAWANDPWSFWYPNV